MHSEEMDVNKMQENIEKLPYPWFGVSHGTDNYEDAIMVTEIVAFQAIFKYLKDNKMPDKESQKGIPIWQIDLDITMKNGANHKAHLTPLGYDTFLQQLKKAYQPPNDNS